jgi:hypothetical protein
MMPPVHGGVIKKIASNLIVTRVLDFGSAQLVIIKENERRSRKCH